MKGEGKVDMELVVVGIGLKGCGFWQMQMQVVKFGDAKIFGA